jgi:hypothetical protein
MASIPVDANFRPQGFAAPVVGGKPLFGGEDYVKFSTRSGIVAPTSAGIQAGRLLAFDDTAISEALTRGDYPSEHIPHHGIALPGGAFTAADFAGIAIFQRALPNRSFPAPFGTVDDPNAAPLYEPEQSITRAVDRAWWVVFDNAAAPVREGQVFVDNVTAGEEGRASVATGVPLDTNIISFYGPEYVQQGLDGLFYAALKFNRCIV